MVTPLMEPGASGASGVLRIEGREQVLGSQGLHGTRRIAEAEQGEIVGLVAHDEFERLGSV